MKIQLQFNLMLVGLFMSLFAATLDAQTRDNGFEFQVVSPESIAGVYDWDGTTDFGPAIEEDFCGDLVWAGDPEEEGCEPLSSDLTGKVALIRRGGCFFSLKVYNAQEAGAKAVVVVNHDEDETLGPDDVIGMSGADSASSVTIPAIFVSYNTGMAIVPALAEGPVEVCFELPTFNLAFGPYAYSTPISQVVPLENMQVRVTNRGITDKTNIETKLIITDPNGNEQELVTVHDAPIGEEVDVTFDPYIPDEIGEYTMRFISGNDGREVERKFEITEHTWAMDNGEVARAIGPSEEQFAEANFFSQHANLVLAGADGIVTHVTFGLGNGAELFVDDPSADIILMAIYDGDRNDDNAIDDFSSFDDLGDPLEIGFYEINGSETFDNLITIPFDNPVAIEEGGIYYVSLAYDGLNAGTGVGPAFSASNDVSYLNFPSTPLQLDQLYSGWAGAILITRLHLEGFVSNTEDFIPLAADKLKILSNPVANGQLTFELNLLDVSRNVNVKLRNLEGKLINEINYENTSTLTESIEVRGLPSGTYFLNVHTDEGFRSEKVIFAN